VVLEYAWEHGPAAAGRHYGLSARTIRRWRKRWRRGGVEELVPSYPRHRARRVSPAAVELIRHARQEFGYGQRSPGSGSSAYTGSGWPWARFSGCFETWAWPACGARASGNPAR